MNRDDNVRWTWLESGDGWCVHINHSSLPGVNMHVCGEFIGRAQEMRMSVAEAELLRDALSEAIERAEEPYPLDHLPDDKPRWHDSEPPEDVT